MKIIETYIILTDEQYKTLSSKHSDADLKEIGMGGATSSVLVRHDSIVAIREWKETIGDKTKKETA